MLARGLRQSLRSQACNARNALRTPQAPLRRKLCSAAAEGAAKEEGLLAKGQVDSGFFQGTALFAGVMFGAQASSEEQRATALDGLVGWYRTMGVSSNITDRQARELTPPPPQLTCLAPRGAKLVHTRPQLTRAPLAAQLIEDFMRKNVAAAANVVMASPVFYFTFSTIVGEKVAVSLVRAVTGTMRIVPFMGVFYGAFAIISPFLVDYFMHDNFMGAAQTYEARAHHATPCIHHAYTKHTPSIHHAYTTRTPWPSHAHGMRHARGPCPHPVHGTHTPYAVPLQAATGTAGLVMIMSGFVAIEAVVELRGCGVLFSQMTASSFAIFIPALVGRLACGVLLQQAKTGGGDESSFVLLPASWGEAGAPTWQAHTYGLFERLHIDKDFAVTSVGTTVFQYMLNAVTYVLLTKGKTAAMRDFFSFMAFGMGGTVLSGVGQFAKTLAMRSCFGFAWNLASSQPVDMPAFDAALDRLPK